MKHCCYIKRLYFIGVVGVFLTATTGSVHALVMTTNIQTNTTWTMADSPVEIAVYDFFIEEPYVLTIEAGVEVRFTGPLYVEGCLKALGEATNRIVFDEAVPGSGAGWGPLVFRCDTNTFLITNILQHVDLANMDSQIYVSEKSLEMMHCSVHSTGTMSLVFGAYVNSSAPYAYANASLTIISNTFHWATDYSGSTAIGFLFDGFNCDFRNNEVSYLGSGDVLGVKAIRLYVSNTEAFTGKLCDNTLHVHVLHPGVLKTYGISYEDESHGLCSNNQISIDAPQGIIGVSATHTNLIIDNEISLVATSNGSYGYVTGIESHNVYSETNDLLVNNSIEIYTDRDSRYLVGIDCQEGRIRGNRITSRHHGGSGYNQGIIQTYYSGYMENNTILLTAPGGVRTRAVNVGTHYNPASTVVVQNNIMVLESGTNSVGLYKDADCMAIVSNRFNLIHGFVAGYSNCVAGPGGLTGDPLFADTDYNLQAFSPAVDVGTNQAWMSNAVDVNRHPRIDNHCVDYGACEYLYLPTITDLNVSNGLVYSSWNVLSGEVYQAQCSTNLMVGWFDYDPVITAQQAEVSLMYTNGSHAFFRTVRYWP